MHRWLKGGDHGKIKSIRTVFVLPHPHGCPLPPFLTQRIHVLTSQISLDQERRNFEDRFLRAQRANAALQPGPSAAELQQQQAELRAQAAAAQREAKEANAKWVPAHCDIPFVLRGTGTRIFRGCFPFH
jgi:hypothetical protein